MPYSRHTAFVISAVTTPFADATFSPQAAETGRWTIPPTDSYYPGQPQWKRSLQILLCRNSLRFYDSLTANTEVILL